MANTVRLASTLALSCLLWQSASAQTGVDPQAAIESWRAEQGASWTAQVDPRTGYASSVYGGHTEAGARLRQDADAFQRARELVARTASMTGAEPTTLVERRAVFLPLSSAGSTDKYTAEFRQVVRGVPVVGASVHVLMDMEGRALSIDSSVVPGAELARTQPIRSPESARAEALRAFARIAGFEGAVVGEPRLALDPRVVDGALRAELVWEVDVLGQLGSEVPRGLLLRLSDADFSLTSREELVHTCDVSGTVYTRLTPGTLPDIVTNPTVQTPLAHVVVQTPQGNAITDINGNFNIVGATAPLNATVKYDGPFTTTVNSATATYSLGVSLTAASGNSIVMNSPASALYTAEANSAYWVGRLRDWTRGLNPLDATADFDALSNVNLAQTCNAFFAGSSINFFTAGGGCVNTSYSTVVVHEMGHWLNVNYGSGNGPDGFGEGNADVFAMYITDQPVVGDNFFTNGGIIRTGLNTTAFCGDANGGCHGEVHFDGEVLMGALWKVRTRLKNSLGASAGALASDLLFNGWMNGFNDTQIKTIVRTHWLMLDDNDGDLNNGTPHFNEINLGFADQGFPLYPLVPVAITGLTQLPNTTNEAGPYVVNVQAVANVAPPLSTPQLFWRVDGGAYTPINMTFVSGTTYTASIPGHVSPAKIEYYVSASNSGGTTAFSPSGAPATSQRFVVGEERVYFSDTLDAAGGWTTGAVFGANDWQHATPAGLGGDPSAPRTGTRCWGTDIGPTGDGLYSANSSSFLQSGLINLSSCPKPRLRFQRWLTIEGAPADTARVVVNGQVIWQNPVGDLLDTGWTEVEYDITAAAAGNPNTRVRFELVSNGSVQKGGWNVDDVQIVTLSANGLGCVDPISYCSGKLTSIGTLPTLDTLGAPSASLANFQVELSASVPNRPGILLASSAGPASTPFSGGTLCLAPPVTRYQTFLTDAFLYAAIPVPITAPMAGQTWWLQTWFRDPPASFGVGLSNALQVHFCQ